MTEQQAREWFERHEKGHVPMKPYHYGYSSLEDLYQAFAARFKSEQEGEPWAPLWGKK